MRVILAAIGILLVGIAFHGSAAGQSPTAESAVSRDSVAASESTPKFSTFQVQTLSRTEFPLARPTPILLARNSSRPISSGPGVRSAPDLSTGRGVVFWDRLAANVSQVWDRSDGRPAVYDSHYGLAASRFVRLGNLTGEGKWRNREGRFDLLLADLKLETADGWSFGVGDEQGPQSGPVVQGLTARGIHISGPRQANDAQRSLWGGISVARSGLQYSDLEEGRFPRRVETGFISARRGRGLESQAQVFHLADATDAALPDSARIHSAEGFGLSSAVQSGRWNAKGVAVGSRVQYGDEAGEHGTNVHVKFRGGVSRATFGGSLENSWNAAYRVGAFGALQSAPKSAMDGDLAVGLLHSSAVSGWLGRWELSSGRGNAGPAAVVESGEVTTSRNRADMGHNWGARITCKPPIIGTTISLSREYRQRSVTGDLQKITTSSVALSRRFRNTVDASIRWDDLSQEGRGAMRNLSGSLSLPVGRGATVTVQQQSAWLEPLGFRVVSIAGISSLPLFPPKILISADVAQIHEEDGGRLHPTQTQGGLSARIRLSGGASLTPRWKVTRRESGAEYSFELGIGHSLTSAHSLTIPTTGELRGDRQAVLRGVAYDDRNGDGIRQSEEPGVAGVGVVLDGNVSNSILCDARGRYQTVVPVARHIVRLLPESVPTAFSIDGLTEIEVDVQSDRPAVVDFPLRRRVGAIVGRVVSPGSDLPGSGGERDSLGVPNVRVSLDATQFTYTDSDGRFAFNQLVPGEYSVTVDSSSLRFGYHVAGDVTSHVSVGEGPSREILIQLARAVRQTRF